MKEDRFSLTEVLTLFRFFQNTSTMLLLYRYTDRCIVEISATLTRFLFKHYDQVIGESIASLSSSFGDASDLITQQCIGREESTGEFKFLIDVPHNPLRACSISYRVFTDDDEVYVLCMIRPDPVVEKTSEHLQIPIEIIPVPVVTIDGSGRIDGFNVPFGKLWQSQSLNELIGCDLFELTSIPLKYTDVLASANQTGSVATSTKAIDKDGNLLDLSLSVYRMSDQQERYVVYFQDWTVQNASMLALIESERTLRRIIEHYPFYAAIVEVNDKLELLLTYANQITCRDFQITELSEALRFKDAIPSLSDKMITSALLDLAHNEVPFVADGYEYNPPNGKKQYFEIYALRLESNVIVLFFRDVSARVTEQSTRVQLEQMLAQSQKMETVGMLAGGIAHDFNNILTPIIGYSDFLLSDTPVDNPHYNFVKQICEASDRAKTLVRQLLAFARKQSLQMSTVDLNRVITDFTKMMRRTVREDIDIQIQLCDCSTSIFGDPSQIEQVLLNLAVNAQDAMPKGGKLLVATSVRQQPEGNSTTDESAAIRKHLVELRVSDNGVGMTPDVVERIFEPFFTTKEAGKGTGLGLSTVYGIVKQHNGSLSVESEPGKGTTFILSFPLTLDANAKAAARPPIRLGLADHQWQNKTILLVEDQPEVSSFIKQVLGRTGCNILVAAGGEEALQISKTVTNRIDLLLTDVIMPGIDGKALSIALKQARPELKTVFMSGYSKELLSERGIQGSETVLVQKPFEIRTLLSTIETVLFS